MQQILNQQVSKPYYKMLQSHGKQDKQYWKKITTEFIKQKHNADTSR